MMMIGLQLMILKFLKRTDHLITLSLNFAIILVVWNVLLLSEKYNDMFNEESIWVLHLKNQSYIAQRNSKFIESIFDLLTANTRVIRFDYDWLTSSLQY
jgi:hypothetical protein